MMVLLFQKPEGGDDGVVEFAQVLVLRVEDEEKSIFRQKGNGHCL